MKGYVVLGFCIVLSAVANAQSNSLGDRAPEMARVQTYKPKTHLTRKQKLLLRKPKARHTAEYEYYSRLEQVAREKQRAAFERIKLSGVPHPKQTAEYAFYLRAEKVAREKQHKLVEMAKPQYTNFAYFGHKRPPKKHLPYAMRYCKECGIRH
ncbi:MAG: hypothetical protein JST48_01080 [Bacteroidetes bacterium]|nr:hypothetical protein [Bacteroidota bacterium]